MSAQLIIMMEGLGGRWLGRRAQRSRQASLHGVKEESRKLD